MMKDQLVKLVYQMVDGGILFEDARAEFEKQFTLAVLAKTGGDLGKAAKLMRVHRNTLSKKSAGVFSNKRMTAARNRRVSVIKELR